MSKWCINYAFDQYEEIEEDGYSLSRGESFYNWNDSDYRREEEEREEPHGWNLSESILW